MCRALVHELHRLDADVGSERAPTLAAAMRAHGVGADVMEDADEVRARIRLLSLHARLTSRCKPPDPRFLLRVVDDRARQPPRRRARGLRQRGRRERSAGHGRRRWHAVARGRPGALLVRLLVHRAPRVERTSKPRRCVPRDRLDSPRQEIEAKPAGRLRNFGRGRERRRLLTDARMAPSGKTASADSKFLYFRILATFLDFFGQRAGTAAAALDCASRAQRSRIASAGCGPSQHDGLRSPTTTAAAQSHTAPLPPRHRPATATSHHAHTRAATSRARLRSIVAVP